MTSKLSAEPRGKWHFIDLSHLPRFTARKYDPSQTISDEDLNKLKTTYEKAQRSLLRWTITNFGDAFHMWVHLKCIQVFVESVLRYGLPANFQASLLIVCLEFYLANCSSQGKTTNRSCKRSCVPTMLILVGTLERIPKKRWVAKSSSPTFSLRPNSNKMFN